VIQQISESNPTAVFPNSQSFAASQGFTGNSATNRVNTLIGFSSIPPSSYGCTLNFYLPPSATLTTSGSATLNVSTIFNGSPAAISTPNNWSWNTIVGTPGVVGSGLFGTTNVQKDARSTVNSMACPAGGGGLGFVIGIASWVWGSASAAFDQGTGAGFYLTYNC
jgi:hypothetical protein